MIPTKIDKLSDTEMLVEFTGGARYALSFVELRFYCPCAACIDEHTGQRTIVRTSIAPDIRPKSVNLVGRYAVHVGWSDGHSTGMYHFDRLLELCEKQGRRLGAV